ncbi:hypothetical protein [Sphingomonas mesophila]|uniref:hypothetical protein n=1 Tax=Sphingomonas mesophila TaxID=2303576 RepID=UPI000E598488|nr:hypothetical protein [Sphingomonas mesophila]
MNAFEYAMALISIVVGLAMADLAISFQKLVRHRETIAWDLRAPLAAAFGFLVLFTMWFEIWSVHARPDILAFPLLLSLVVEFVLLFLAATMILPDDPAPDLDLGVYYEANARAIWALFLLFQASFFAHWVYFVAMRPDVTMATLAVPLLKVMAAPAAALLLMLTPRRKLLHLVVITLLILHFLAQFWDDRIVL